VFDPNASIGSVILAPIAVVQSGFDMAEVNKIKNKAEQGDAIAQLTLARCYANGRGVPRNPTEAVKWYRLSAEQGNAAAQNSLGVCYWTGRGVTQDYAEAMRWCRKAADQGNAYGEDNVGDLYFRGLGVAQDYEQAMNWFRKAADQGLALAQTHVEVCNARIHGAVEPTSAASEPPAQTAIGVDELKELTSTGVKPQSMIEEIKATNSKYSPQEIAILQQANLDPAVIDYIKTNAASTPQ
jgi:tetratricopeptide (TPR) repeat protein